MKRNNGIIRLATRAARIACATVLLLVFLAPPQGTRFDEQLDQPHVPHGENVPVEATTRVEWVVTGNASPRTVSNSSSAKTSVLPAFESLYNDYMTARSKASRLTISV